MSQRLEDVDMLITDGDDMSVLLQPLAALLDGEAIVVSDAELRKYIGRTIRMEAIGGDDNQDSVVRLSLVAA